MLIESNMFYIIDIFESLSGCMQVILARENMYATSTHTQHAAVDWSLFLQIIFTDF